MQYFDYKLRDAESPFSEIPDRPGDFEIRFLEINDKKWTAVYSGLNGQRLDCKLCCMWMASSRA